MLVRQGSSLPGAQSEGTRHTKDESCVDEWCVFIKGSTYPDLPDQGGWVPVRLGWWPPPGRKIRLRRASQLHGKPDPPPKAQRPGPAEALARVQAAEAARAERERPQSPNPTPQAVLTPQPAPSSMGKLKHDSGRKRERESEEEVRQHRLVWVWVDCLSLVVVVLRTLPPPSPLSVKSPMRSGHVMVPLLVPLLEHQ